MKPFLPVLAFCLQLFFTFSLQGQMIQASTTVIASSPSIATMQAGKQFSASRTKQFWWGTHWRKEWLTEVDFPILNMDTTFGGLTPKREGGGKETKSLRVLAQTGKEYVLRSIDKNPDTIVPAEYKGSFIETIIDDQVCMAHPYSAIVVAQLSEDIGILHTNPVLVYVPDNNRLGKYKQDFAGKLCLMEERPNGDGWENTALTGYAREIINTDKLYERLAADNRKQVDQLEFLKARLFDIFINDWDRHSDQWLWAATKNGKNITYRPFARDRDQAFSKTDGIWLTMFTQPWGQRHIQSMHTKITDVIGSTQSGVWMDKKFLNQLTAEDWAATITNLQQSLTDERIAEAIQQLPPPVYKLSADYLYKRLRSRRDDMMRYGMRYYHILNKKVDITASDRNEIVTINKNPDHTTEITITPEKEKGDRVDTIYHRVFDKNTKQINLYGFAGDDVFNYDGNTNNSTLIRSFGNEGHDLFLNKTDSAFKFTKIKIYDVSGDASATTQGLRYHTTNDTSVTNYHREAFKYDWWMPIVNPGYNPDDGVIVGLGFTYKKQSWNKSPFGWQQTIIGNYAAATGAFDLKYKGIFTHALGKWDLDLKADYKSPGFIVNFYGYGNETKLDQDKSFYRTRARSFFINPQGSKTWGHNNFKTGLLFNSVKIENNHDKFITQPIAGIDSSVFTTNYFGGVNASYTFTRIDSLRYPTKGIRFATGADYIANLQHGHNSFVKINSSLSWYWTPFRNVTIAHRTGGAFNAGQFEFYQANTLGGYENLRGYWRSRFTGKSSIYQNTDLRVKLGTLNGYVFRGVLGVYGFFDTGKVWVEDEHSNTLHWGYGGGIYFLPFNAIAFNMYYAKSNEVNTFTIRTGFFF